jgi:hypothetical protein
MRVGAIGVFSVLFSSVARALKQQNGGARTLILPTIGAKAKGVSLVPCVCVRNLNKKDKMLNGEKEEKTSVFNEFVARVLIFQ